MSDPMTGIRRAASALEEAKKQARQLIADAQVELGREILAARASEVQQKDIAAELKLTREQIRRFQVAARDADQAAAGSPAAE
ncbi:hypothetical protein [Streptosporangium sp. G12]